MGANRDYGIAPPRFQLPDATHVGAIRLQVSDVERSIAYYTQLLGFTPGERDRHSVRLHVGGAREHLIELQERPGTTPVPQRGLLGLYHFAILLPSRADLGRFVKHIVAAGVQFGAADHLVSEATYLWDPDNLGIEVYADRPRESWHTNGRELMMTTERLDVDAVIGAGGGEPWSGMPAGTTMGHMHLSVGDLAAARSFYHEALGLEQVVWSYPGALFMSAGGYHHHLGTNTWARGARAATDADARLLEWELRLPTDESVAEALESLKGSGYTPNGSVIADPWGTRLRVKAPIYC